MDNIEISPEQLLDNLEMLNIESDSLYTGSQHVIKKCTIISTGQKAVIKTSINDEGVASLINEYNALVKCSHPAIQKVVGLYNSENPNEKALVTPFYPQGTLDQFIESKNNELGMTLKYIITIGIAAGMKYLHKHSILHKNLKPKSILINDDNRPIIYHFGFVDENENDDSIIYSAPEVIENNRYDEKSDVYSFGLMSNEFFSTKKLFDGIAKNEILNLKKQGNIEISNSIPKFFKEIITKCLNPDPSNRPTFKEIFQIFRSNLYRIPNESLIISYINEIRFESKRKRSFKIPHQILKLPSPEFPWNRETEDPINWDEFFKVFKPDDEKNVLIIMTFGGTQTGKSTFLRTITGNQAYYSGSGISSTTIGLLIDGPYKKSSLIDQIFDDEYKEKFSNLNIPDDTDIFFLDSQGIGDEHYSENFSLVLDRIHSIFSSVSTLCISLADINTPYEVIQKFLKIVRRTQSLKYKIIYLLIKGYDKFDKLEEITYDSINGFQNQFITEYWDQYKATLKFYSIKYIIPLPIGNCKSNYENYIYSSWYDFYSILSHIEEESIVPRRIIIEDLRQLTYFLFGNHFNTLYQEIIENPNINAISFINSFPESQRTTAEVLKLCSSSCYFLANTISFLLSPAQISSCSYEETMTKILFYTSAVSKIILPFFLSDFNIPLSDSYEYIYEMTNDIQSYITSNTESWRGKMKIDNIVYKFCKPVTAVSTIIALGSDFIPVVGWATEAVHYTICGSLYLYAKTTLHMLDNIKKEFTPTIYPFIWNRNLIKAKKNNFDLNNIKQIGGKKDQLIVFYEQNGNDSTLLFRSLTGFDVNFINEQQVSQVFLSASIKNMMARFKRYKKIHSSNLENQNINILYAKGCSQGQISALCYTQGVKPIFVSSILEGQKLTIMPEDGFLFHLFYVSKNSYEKYTVDRKSFVSNMNCDRMKNVKTSLGMKNGNLLAVNSKNYNFYEAGPIAHALIRYGCKFILQDKSFDKE